MERSRFLFMVLIHGGEIVSDREGPGSVMRNVSKAKFDDSLLVFALLERV